MSLASYILSLCLHIAGILLIWLWPVGEPLINPQQPVLISLVDGDPGGNRTPSPILGHMGEPGEGELAPTPPAKRAEVAATEREETMVAPAPAPDEDVPVRQEPRKPDVQPLPRPAPVEEVVPKKVEKKPEARPEKVEAPKQEPPKKVEPKKEEAKKEPPKKAEPKKEPPKKEPPKKETPKKEEPRKQDGAKKPSREKDAVAAAMEQARRQATSRADSGDRGSSVERALAEARRQASGSRGGGGGAGSGPGGGGLNDVYLGQVRLAVRANWGFASSSRQNLQCTVLIQVSVSGEVQDCRIVRSSGSAQFDSSCVNAVMRTSRAGDFPPPPSKEYQEFEVGFNLNELRGA